MCLYSPFSFIFSLQPSISLINISVIASYSSFPLVHIIGVLPLLYIIKRQSIITLYIMRVSVALVVAALTSFVSCQLPNSFEVPATGSYPTLTAGQPYTFTWENLSGSTVTLTLRDGDPSHLNQGSVIQGTYKLILMPSNISSCHASISYTSSTVLSFSVYS